jgi:hypothetical protein
MRVIYPIVNENEPLTIHGECKGNCPNAVIEHCQVDCFYIGAFRQFNRFLIRAADMNGP